MLDRSAGPRQIGAHWIDLLFFLSGAAALSYEIVWTRRLSLFFGSTAAAIAVILALFLFGLALGSIVLPRPVLALARRPVRAYGVLEIAAGILALGFPALLPWCDEILAGADAGRMDGLLRGAIAALLVVPPTMALGGTLPVLAQAFAGRPDVGRRVGRLYAWNTLGACAGALAAAFFLLPGLGQLNVLLLLPATNVLVGVVALFVARSEGRAAGERAVGGAHGTVRDASGSADEECPGSAATFPGGRRAFLFAFLSGLLLLALEVGVARFIALSVSQSIYGFAIMLVTFIGGLAVGAFAAGRLGTSAETPWERLGQALVVGGAGIALVPTALVNLPWWLTPAVTSGRSSPFAVWVVLQLGAAFLILLPATLSLGLVFPILLRQAALVSERARIIGWLYAWNTLGAILGSTIAGFLVLPAIGPRSLLIGLAALSLAAGFYLVFRWGRPAPWLLLPAALAAPFLVLPREVDPELLSRSPAVYAKTARLLVEHRRLRGGGRRLEFIAHDEQGTVVVAREAEGERGGFRFFSVNGKIDGGESAADMATQVQLATMPLVLFDRGRSSASDVLVIGLGTGVSVGSALTFPVARVDVVEISRPMLEVARRFFAESNRRALDDPRTHVHVTDGRRFLTSSRSRYDVIVSEPSNPWIAGIGSLYTREAFELCRKRLSPGGVMCQWVQTYDLDEVSFRMIVATFTDVFPESYLFVTDRAGSDFMLIGFASPDPSGFSSSALRLALERRARVDTFDPHTPGTLEELAEHFLAGPAGLRAYSATALRNTDDNGALEFQAPKAFLSELAGLHGLRSLPAVFGPFTEQLTLDPGEPDELTDRARSTALSWKLFVELWLRSGFLSRMPSAPREIHTRALEVVLEFTRETGPCSAADLLLGLLYEFGDGPEPGELVKFGPGWNRAESVAAFRRSLGAREQLETRLALALVDEHDAAGVRYGPGSDLVDAERQYRSVLDRDPRDRTALVGLAGLLNHLDRRPEAERLLAEESQRDDADPDVVAYRGVLLAELSRAGEAVELLRRALAAHPDHDHLTRALAHAEQLSTK